MEPTPRVVGVFDASDPVPPMIPDQLGSSLDERLHLFLLHVLIDLLFGLVGFFQPLAGCL